MSWDAVRRDGGFGEEVVSFGAMRPYVGVEH